MYSVVVTRHRDGVERTVRAGISLPQALALFRVLDARYHWEPVTIAITTAAPGGAVRRYQRPASYRPRKGAGV